MIKKETSLTARCDTALQCALDGGSNAGSSCGSPGSSTGGYRTVTTHHYTDWYNVRSNGTKELSNVQYNGSTTEYVWVSNTSNYGAVKTLNYTVQSGYNNISHTRSRPSNIRNSPKDIVMDKTMKRTKVLCAYQRLAFQSNGLFKKTIGKFKSDADYDLLFTVKPMPSNRTQADAITINQLNTKGFVEIRINPSKANGNPLEMAQLLLHEGIHAEIHRYVQEKTNNVDVTDRPRLMQLFQHYIGLIPSSQLTPSRAKYQMGKAQHNYMAEKYVKPISEALRQFDNNRFPAKDYEGLSWEGLKDYYNLYGNHTVAEEEQLKADSQKVKATYKNDSNAPCN